MTTLTVSTPAKPAGSAFSFLIHAWRWFLAAQRVAAERQALLELDDRTLTDIGIDRRAARIESERPFGDLPPAVWARLRDGGRF